MKTKSNPHHASENLFQFVSPEQLKANVLEVFFGYLMHVENEPPRNFKEIVEDFYILLDFLDEVQKDEHLTSE